MCCSELECKRCHEPGWDRDNVNVLSKIITRELLITDTTWYVKTWICKEWKFWLGFPSKGNKDLIFCVYSRKTSECFIFGLKYVVCSAFCDAAELKTIKKKTKLNYLFLSFAHIISMPLHCYELLPIGRWCLQSRQERDLDNVDTWVATKTWTDHTHDTWYWSNVQYRYLRCSWEGNM